MDGENNGSKPYFLMDNLGGNKTPLFSECHPAGIWVSSKKYPSN